MRAFANTHRRWGYKRAWHISRQEGLGLGREAFRRLWRQEDLRVLPRKASKRRLGHPQVKRTSPATRPNEVWALDFQFDSDYNARTFKVCNIIDEFTREHIAFRIDRSLSARDVVELLDVTMLERGATPQVLRMDNGPEFIARALASWCREQNSAQAFAPPGQPWHNGFIESLHNRIRDELFEDNVFEDLSHARDLMAWWSDRYNQRHPHSALGYISPAQYAQQWAQAH